MTTDTMLHAPPPGRFRAVLPLMLLLFTFFAPPVQAQDLDGPDNVLVRVTGNPMTPLLGGPQMPPYQNLGLFLANAFVTPSDDMVLIQDSSVCSNGVQGTSDFNPFLVAKYTQEDGRLTGIEFYRVEGNGERTKFSRKQFIYDGNHLAQYLYSLWEEQSDSWLLISREIFAYDVQNRLVESRVQAWSGTDWTNVSRNALDFSPEGTLDAITYFEWDNGQFTPVQRTTGQYNQNRLPIQVMHQDYHNAAWRTTVQETYGYDDALEFILESYVRAVLDTATGTVDPTLRELYQYDLRGFYEGRTQQAWNADSAKWENVQRDLFSYSRIGIWKEWTHQVWDTAWQNDFFRESKYNEGRQLDVHHNWDAVSQEWVNGRRRFVQFDDYGNLIFERNNEKWNATSDDWENGQNTTQCRHYWSEDLTSGISYQRENLIECNLMNPYLIASEIQCLSLDHQGEYQARVVDQMGRLVHYQTFHGGESFALRNHVPAGLYYLMIADKHQVMYQRKMVIQN